jgi:hypothetical protein
MRNTASRHDSTGAYFQVLDAVAEARIATCRLQVRNVGGRWLHPEQAEVRGHSSPNADSIRMTLALLRAVRKRCREGYPEDLSTVESACLRLRVSPPRRHLARAITRKCGRCKQQPRVDPMQLGASPHGVMLG